MSMESATSPAENPLIELAVPIQSRDGTLTRDSRMVNCCSEQSTNGKAVTKRPGTANFFTPPQPGPAQGQFYLTLVGQAPVAYSIVGDTIYNTLTGTAYAIPNSTTHGLQYQCLNDVPAGKSLLKNSTGLWIFNGTTVTKVTDANYPAQTVSGIAYLDGTYYVMDQLGNVQGSALEDPTTWPALNFIAADATLGAGGAIQRHLNYIVAMYTRGTQLYWDAGQSPGIPLAAVSNAAWRTGVSTNANTLIVEIQDMTFWIANTGQYGRTVVQLAGLQMNTISNPYIDRVLNLSTLSSVYCLGLKVGGHSYYVITLADLELTLVYDLVFGDWYQWTSLNTQLVEKGFAGVNYIETLTMDLVQDRNTGNTLSVSASNYQDTLGAAIMARIVTNPMDWKTLALKRFAAMFLLADTVQTTVQLSFTDDDYQTFSVPRTIDLSSVRKMVQRCGTSRRRAWQLLHTDNTPFRVYQMETRMSIGPQ